MTQINKIKEIVKSWKSINIELKKLKGNPRVEQVIAVNREHIKDIEDIIGEVKRIKMKSIINISIFGYGFKINFFGYNKKEKHDDSLSKWEIRKYWSKYNNPGITFVINYRWFCFHLLLNRD